MADWAQLCDWCTLIVASEIIQSISDEIIYHVVEEEARLMRVIMHKAKEESAEFVKIIQETQLDDEFPQE